MTLHILRYIISDVFLIIFLILLFFGIWGMFRFKTSFGRILNSSKIDSVAAIFLMLGLIIRANSLGITLKLIVILIFYLLTNPVVNQLIAFSAKKHLNDQILYGKEGQK
jgi:multicomponent Na+:H+ antiporter subunit G